MMAFKEVKPRLKSDRVRPTLVPENPVSEPVPDLDPDAAFRARRREEIPVELNRVFDGFARIVADAFELSPR